MTQEGMNEERNEDDKYKLIMIVVVMKHVLFEWMKDLMRKVGWDLWRYLNYNNEWMIDFYGMCYFEWMEVVW